jgi:hypothetical protein
MIKFFRKLRYDLMDNNKTSRYLKYAIGEIVLVVIGILIALSINNWNENRKNLVKKETLLKALQIEFSSNLTQLDTVLYYDDIVLKNIRGFMKLDPNISLEMTNDSMPNWFQNSSYRWTFNPLNGALRSGISSGEIHLIKNDSLSNLLFGWEDFVTDAKEGEVRTIAALIASKDIIERHIRSANYRTSFLPPELGKSRFLSDYQSLFRDPLFEDYLVERYMSMNEVLVELNNVKKKNTLILKLINIELNKS